MAVPILGTGLALGGNLLGGLNNASAQRRQNSILAQGSRQQNRAGMESAGVMGDFLTQLRGSRPDAGAERGAFTAALGNPTITGPPTASSRFRADAAGATAGTQGYGRQLADLFARIRAPGLQRQNESEAMVRMGDALRPIQVRAQDDEFLTQLRAGMKQPNPWLGMLGSGLSNMGQYLIANGNPKSTLTRGGPATGMGANIGGNFSDILTSGVVA